MVVENKDNQNKPPERQRPSMLLNSSEMFSPVKIQHSLTFFFLPYLIITLNSSSKIDKNGVDIVD